MQKRMRWVFRIIIFLGILFLVIYLKDGKFFNTKTTVNHNIDSVNVYYGNTIHKIYITDTLNFAGEPIPVGDSSVRQHLKYLLTANASWIPLACNAMQHPPVVINLLKKQIVALGVPADFSYVAFNESHLENVTSTNGMCGIWQLEANTARRFGLRVDSVYDERLKLPQATMAAAHYIQHLHSLYGSWIFAAAAYNTGPGLINYNMQYLKVKNANEFFHNYYLSWYVLHIVAFKMIFDYAAKQAVADSSVKSN